MCFRNTLSWKWKLAASPWGKFWATVKKNDEVCGESFDGFVERRLHGKVVTHGNIEEQHIVFQLMDNTPHDVIQSCVFVVTKAPDECESIVTVCNTFLGRTPRPLLERKPLAVCEDGVREAEMEVEVEPERKPEAEDTDDANEGKEATPATAPDVDVTSDSELI